MYYEEVDVINNNPPVNATQAVELAFQYGQVTVDSLEWNDLNCVTVTNSAFEMCSLSMLLVLLNPMFYFLI